MPARTRSARLLVVVTGPIAAGKSTVARELADRLLAAGSTVAVVDVDEVAAMVHGGLSDWDLAHQVHGRLVAAWLDRVDTVIADGPIYSRQETNHLIGDVSGDVRLVRVMLRATYPTALRRVTGDPDRGLSKDPAFLRRAYERFEALRPDMDACDLEFDAEQVFAEKIADEIAAHVACR
ncbi:hypothetical protein GCM10023169_10100 [Georgenia halophila]|uniref:Dephospho-CoA kinase n=1 Tax=Georgenia halophila TaxID=620889 RepID=A0ABP8KZJ7_9MICO